MVSTQARRRALPPQRHGPPPYACLCSQLADAVEAFGHADAIAHRLSPDGVSSEVADA